jgi:WXG100 protein secretion system (Wss), protein YukD
VTGRRVRLLTVAGVDATTDVVVAADIPVGELQPALAELLGDHPPPPDDPCWVLAKAGGTVLRPTATLHDQQVQDGEVLSLRAGRPDPVDAPAQPPMGDPAWHPDPPGPTPAPAGRRFGAATLGHPRPGSVDGAAVVHRPPLRPS